MPINLINIRIHSHGLRTGHPKRHGYFARLAGLLTRDRGIERVI